MFHRNKPFFATFFGCLTLLIVWGAANPDVAAQQKRSQTAAEPTKPSKELWQLLSDWSKASDSIQKLHGQHVRHSYDSTFGVEKISQGEFWYAAPDKGRIDVKPVTITPKMQQDRQAPGARVRRKNGKPYDLQSDDSERWICDGSKIFDIDELKKEARVVQLPPEVRGTNIINSPLPFLFGLPPEKAVERFNMKIVKDWRPKHQQVMLEAVPRTRKDLNNWSKAEFYLDTKTFLPSAVKLVDPAGEKDTVYKFHDMEVNKNGLITRLLGKNPWDPKLGRDYTVHVTPLGEQPPNTSPRNTSTQKAQQEPQSNGPVIPNVVGKDHATAKKILLAAGVPKANISLQRGGPAPRQNLTYRVKNQQPAANTPLHKASKIVLMVFEKPKVQ